jgi:hypothetical protein
VYFAQAYLAVWRQPKGIQSENARRGLVHLTCVAMHKRNANVLRRIQFVIEQDLAAANDFAHWKVCPPLLKRFHLLGPPKIRIQQLMRKMTVTGVSFAEDSLSYQRTQMSCNNI